MNEQQKEALFAKMLRFERGMFTKVENQTKDAFFQELIDTGTYDEALKKWQCTL